GQRNRRRLHARSGRDEGDRRGRAGAGRRLPASGHHGASVTMFSQALEIVLTIAHREATARRHAYLTLEHLLYALAHDPDGEAILGACGADLPKLRQTLDTYLADQVEQFPRGREKDPAQTVAFRRVLQTAVLHVQSAGRGEVRAGDVLAAALQETRSF